MINYDPVYDWGGLLKDYTLNYINYFQTDFLYVLATPFETEMNWIQMVVPQSDSWLFFSNSINFTKKSFREFYSCLSWLWRDVTV